MGVVGLAMMLQSEDGGPAPLSQALTGAVLLVGSAVAAASAARGYALSVTSVAVVAHGLRDRVIPFSQIDNVDVVQEFVRLFQLGSCLSFRTVDGSEFVFKNFNAGYSRKGKGLDQLLEAKDLIERRVAENQIINDGV